MRLRSLVIRCWLLIFLMFCNGLWALSVQAQVTADQVTAFVEALRLAAPKTGIENDGLYSDWQVKPDNITRWSKRCLGITLTIEEFESSPQLARQVLECKMGQVLAEQYEASNGKESVAVQRAAAWWMTGDADRYNQPPTDTYTKKVLDFYWQQRNKSRVSSSLSQ